MLNPDDFRRSIQAIDALGATPAVLAKVAELAKDPDADLATLGELLRNDGPLVADIIRISNSPYYAPTTPHSNLTSAIGHVGMAEVVRVVNLSLSRRLFAHDLPGYGVSATDYWSASIAAALVMEALAKQSGLDPEDAYTIGILHAMGRVLINRVIEDQRFTLFWDGQQPIQEWERSSVGFDYAEAGAMLLEHWRFPDWMCEVIRGQVDPDQAIEAGPAEITLVRSLRFTLRLLALSGLDFENKGWQMPETDPYMRASGLTPDALFDLITGCRETFKQIVQSVAVH